MPIVSPVRGLSWFFTLIFYLNSFFFCKRFALKGFSEAVLRVEALLRDLGQLLGLVLALDLCTSNGRLTITYKNKYNFSPVLLMATKIAKVNKLSQGKETIPVDAGRFLLARLTPTERAAGARAASCCCFCSRRSSRVAGNALRAASPA